MTPPPATSDPDADVPTAGLAERAAAWFAPTPAEVIALVVLLLGSVAATLLWWYGSLAAPAAPTPAATAGAALDDGSPVPPPAPAEVVPPPEVADAAAVTVYVSGAVASPGLATLPPGARVGDAVAAAGGLAAGADSARINLARAVVDGEQVHVPVEGEDPVEPSAGARPSDPGGTGTSRGDAEGAGAVDLNRAGAVELEQLPGIGPTRAAAIVAHRAEHGPFRSPGDLRAVPGIGEATFQTLAPLIVVR